MIGNTTTPDKSICWQSTITSLFAMLAVYNDPPSFLSVPNCSILEFELLYISRVVCCSNNLNPHRLKIALLTAQSIVKCST